MGINLLSSSHTPELDARLLLQHVLKRNHAYLIAHNEEPLSDRQEKLFSELIGRAARREPIPYITGHAPFFGHQFAVNPSVLIPRPETEFMVQEAINWCSAKYQDEDQLHIVDVGTGSGCIAISLALALPQARIEAIDISADALQVARTNALKYDVCEQIGFHQGKLLESLELRVDMVVANLPYVADHEWTSLDDGVKWYEPELALRGGPEGIDLITLLLEQASYQLAPGGAIFLEIGWQQGNKILQIARKFFESAKVTLIPDLAGLDRIMLIERQS